jgi:hypothetical protein
MQFREESVTPVRHWMCEQAGCDGELVSTGDHKIEYTVEASLRQVRPRRLGGCSRGSLTSLCMRSDLTTPIPEKLVRKFSRINQLRRC